MCKPCEEKARQLARLPNCNDTTVQALGNYLAAYLRVQNENLYNDLGFSEIYVQTQLNLVNISIAAKQLDSSSCTNSEYFNAWANDYAQISLL
jgi:hypothetical protein